MKAIAYIFTVGCLLVYLPVWAAWVTADEAHTVAGNFVAVDAVGSEVLKGCQVDEVLAYRKLWVATLKPRGHIILSGSDKADPIVAFSDNDFREPDECSPAYAMLGGASDASEALESSGDGSRHWRWSKFLGGGRVLLGAAANPEASAVIVKPFLSSHWNQWQPYNDYSPIHETDESKFASGYQIYRGRCPCGCTATAAAQGLYYFRWPARMDRTATYNHNFTDDSGNRNVYPIRFNGFLPIAWGSLTDKYTFSSGDMRGKVAEAVRYPIARLILFADVSAYMSFYSGGSSAGYGTVASNIADWYTVGTWVDADDTRILADLQNGIPVQASIPGHAVVGHGWADDGANKYLYLNYGWGGSNDGYYNIDSTNNDKPIQQVRVGHYPRAKPQLDPLPKVCGTSLELNWHFPDIYTNRLTGFTIEVAKISSTPSTLAENFGTSSGISSVGGIYVGTDETYGYDGNLLYTTASATGTYTFPGIYTLTSASVLTFKMLSFSALGAIYEVQASFDGGEWETIAKPMLQSSWGSSGWSNERVYLGEHGGEMARFRIKNSRQSGSSYYTEGRILIDDFKLTQVLAMDDPVAYNVGKSVRSHTVTGLLSGSAYSFIVVPTVSDALVPGEPSDEVLTLIAGLRHMPIPGKQSYQTTNMEFSASDSGGMWSYSGTMVDDTTIMGKYNCTIKAALPGSVSSASRLLFGWSASNYYGNGADTLKAVFVDVDGNETLLWTQSNSANSNRQNIDISLSALAGQSGIIKISYVHSGSSYTGSQYGGSLYNPRITNVLEPIAPAVEWRDSVLTSLGMPEIYSVSAATEGFYRECGIGTTVFNVTCSESVDTLEAFPSHLALVSDDDVVVTKTGKGKFAIRLTPSGVTASNYRSRMILTLAATDANGTKAYKDISLRFAPIATTVPSVVPVSVTTSDNEKYNLSIEGAWLVEHGLVSETANSAECAAALSADADFDGDGIPNWAEYVCGTDPVDEDDKLTVTLEMVNGVPVVRHSVEGKINSAFKAIIKGSDDLSNWTVVPDSSTSGLHYFRVEIVPE